MRKSIIAAVVGVLALALSATALAAVQQQFRLTFTSKRPNTSTGTSSFLQTSDPDAPPPTHKPPRVIKVDITFPAGTRSDTSVRPYCPLPDNTPPATLKASRACQRAIVGSGSAQVNTGLANNFDPTAPLGFVNVVVTAYNKRNKIIFANQNPVAPQSFAGTIRGNRLTVPVPPLPAGAVLTTFKLNTFRITTGRGRRARNYMTTPRTCPRSGHWTTKAVISFDGSPTQVKSWNTACTRR